MYILPALLWCYPRLSPSDERLPPVCNIATAEALFDALSNELESRDLPWSNVIGYASDLCSMMVGAHNSVLNRLRTFRTAPVR